MGRGIDPLGLTVPVEHHHPLDQGIHNCLESPFGASQRSLV